VVSIDVSKGNDGGSGQFSKWHAGKYAKNMWDEDTRRFAGHRA
jgi:hypothetical protein